MLYFLSKICGYLWQGCQHSVLFHCYGTVMVKYFYLLFSHESEKDVQLPLLPVYKVAYLLIFLSSSTVLWLIFLYFLAFLPLRSSYNRQSNFFSGFGVLMEAFVFTSSDSLVGLQQWLSSVQDPLIYMLYLIWTNVAFRVLAVLLHSGWCVRGHLPASTASK